MREKVLILGNGTSRLSCKEYILHWDNEIWACNWAYKESKQYPNITRIGTVHDDVIEKALLFRSNMSADYDIWTVQWVLDNTKIEPLKKSPLIKIFHYKKVKNTGSLMILQGLYEKKDIYLLGFDMGGPDIYQKTDRPKNSFRKQFIQIIKKFGNENIHFVGKQPDLTIEEYDERDFMHV